jgi:hypothetical protein
MHPIGGQGVNMGVSGNVAYQQQQDQPFDSSQYNFETAKSSRDNWRTFVKILAVVIMIWAGVSIILGIFNILGDIRESWGSNSSSVEYTGSSNSVQARFSGLADIIISAIQMLIYSIVFYQGLLSFQTTRKNSSEAIRHMIRTIMIFMVVYIILECVQITIAFFVIRNATGDTSDMTEDEKTAMTTAIATILFMTFCVGCYCICYCCSFVLGFHYMYKSSQFQLELAEKNLNVGQAPPNVYTSKQNQMT